MKQFHIIQLFFVLALGDVLIEQNEDVIVITDVENRDGLFKTQVNNSMIEAYFVNGKFVPSKYYKQYLKSTPYSKGPNVIIVDDWLEQKSMFTWNSESQCWDEIVLQSLQFRSYCKEIEPKKSPLYSLNGDSTLTFKATFPHGKFTPEPDSIQYLQSEVINPGPSYSYTDSWQQQPALWIWNPDNNCYYQFNVRTKGDYGLWCQVEA